MTERETVVLNRDCKALFVPIGIQVNAKKGSEVTILQQLGGSYTIMTDMGGMLRIDARNADALGKELPEPGAQPEPAIPMKKMGVSGYWEATVDLYPGEHHYSYILEGGRRIPDPTILTREKDDFGGENSILDINRRV